MIVHGQALFWTAARVDADDRTPFVSQQGERLTNQESEYWDGLLDFTRTALTYVASRLRVPQEAPRPARAARARSRGPS